MKARMSPLRSVVHHGFVSASGFLFDLDFVEIDEARSRILSMWTAGSKVFKLPDALVLVLARPVPSFCDSTPGLPLVALNTSAASPLTSVPLTEKQIDSFRPPFKSVVRAKHGEVRIDLLDEDEDPANWLDLTQYSQIRVTPPKVMPSPTVPEINEQPFDPRTEFSGIPPAAPQMREFVDSLRQDASQGSSSQRGLFDSIFDGLREGGRGVSGSDTAGGISNWLRSLFQPQDNQGAGSSQPSRTFVPPQRDTNDDSDDFTYNFRLQLYRFLSATGIADLFHKKQAAYMYALLDKFEQGDWSEALRYAIPLSKDSSGRVLPSLGVPAPRGNLDLNLGQQTPAGSAMFAGDELFQRMRRLYRNAFERLAAEGRIDEAAYVIVELLQEYEEALAFLEKHKRFETAAKLSESRELRPELIVRLWILANNPKRAMLIARKAGCFAEAVRLLTKEHPELANALRVMWASHLADSGNYAAAAMVANIPEMAHLSLKWTKLALELGDPNSGQLLANWLVPFPADEWPQLKEYAIRLLEDESRELAPARHTFAIELGKSSILRSAEAHVLIRAALRATVADYGRGYVAINRRTLKQLVHSSNDAGLQVDISALRMDTEHRDLASRTEPLTFLISSNDVGINKLYDCSYLRNGNSIVAMAEAGICMLDGEGRILKHWTVPADRFVISQYGDRALAIANRGDAKRITRVDFVSGKSEYLGEFLIDVFADNYDGSVWYAAKEEQLYVVDAMASRIKVLWRMPNVLTNVQKIVSGLENCSFIASGLISQDVFGRPMAPQSKTEVWRCDVPGMILRRRIDITQSLLTQSVLTCTVTPAGDLIEARTISDEQDDLSIRIRGAPILSNIPRVYDSVVTLTATNRWFALIATRVDQSGPAYITSCYLIDIASGVLRARIEFHKTLRLVARFDNETLSLCDDLGRLVVLDLKHGMLVKSIRV